MARPQYGHLWTLAHAERAALAKDLAGLNAARRALRQHPR
jgi:hypothetical protein